MPCKVGQVCCREDLNRVGAQVIARILKLLKDRRVGFSVSVENVPEDCGQLVDLTRGRCRTNIGSGGIVVRRPPSSSLVLTLGFLQVDQHCQTAAGNAVLTVHLRDIEVTTPVVC